MEYGWKKKIFEDFMLNNKLDLDEKEKIDNYLFNIKHKNKNINIYSGKGDSDIHTLEFIEHFKKNSKNKINFSFSEDEKLNHSNLFRLYLPEAMKVLMEDKSKINKNKNKLWKKVFNMLNKMKSK